MIMPLTQCPKCGAWFLTPYEKCPKCAHQIKKIKFPPYYKQAGVVCIVLGIVLIWLEKNLESIGLGYVVFVAVFVLVIGILLLIVTLSGIVGDEKLRGNDMKSLTDKDET
jgi:hypothetical protein